MALEHSTLHLPQAYKDRVRKTLENSALVYMKSIGRGNENKYVCLVLNRKDLALAAHDMVKSAQKSGGRPVEGDKIAPFVAAHRPGDVIGLPTAPRTRLMDAEHIWQGIDPFYSSAVLRRLSPDGRSKLTLALARTRAQS